jgi:hypothetical protein
VAHVKVLCAAMVAQSDCTWDQADVETGGMQLWQLLDGLSIAVA